jgi:hypothetical protein
MCGHTRLDSDTAAYFLCASHKHVVNAGLLLIARLRGLFDTTLESIDPIEYLVLLSECSLSIGFEL